MIGQRVSRYEILEKIGQGGMGAVYKARDSELDRVVALKFLPPEKAGDDQRRKRFAQEARAASALNHPNIITIYEISPWEEGQFMAVEYVDGQTLRSLLRQPFAIPDFLAAARQMAEALSVAHAAGIVHRDIKPDNIMLRADGYVKVLDFGIARLQPNEGVDPETLTSGRTAPGTVIGTARYMSPEQAQGRVAESASDVFSLGITFYEMLTTRHPFASTSPFGTLHAIVTGSVLPPSRLNPQVPQAIEDLLLRMLEKDPAARPSASEVRAALAAPATTPALAAGSRARRVTVGFDSQRGQLRAAFAATIAGRGSMTCISGEPGMGKTTLAEDFLAEVTECGHHTWIARGRCSERLAGAEAYLPFLEAFDSLLHGESGDLVAQTLRALAPVWYLQVAPRIGEPTMEGLTAEAKRASQERMKRELHAFLAELARSRPVFLFFDDLHWADASTADLLAYIGARCQSMRLLIIATYRPSDLRLSRHSFVEVELDLQSRGAARHVDLEFLTRDDIARYLALTFPEHRFPDAFVDLVYERTEGNAMFMADLLRYLRDRRDLAVEGGVWTVTRGLDDIRKELPESVRSMVQRKIERVSDADRKLLTAAAVEGSRFDSAVIGAVLSLDPADVEEQLQSLEKLHNLVRCTGEAEFPDGTLTAKYRFVHALYQDALYAAVTPSRRVSLSAATAGALMKFYGERSRPVASDLAILLETARQFGPAAEAFLTASRNAARVFAHAESYGLARRGLQAIEKLPDSPERRTNELYLYIMLGVSAMSYRGYAAPEVETAFLRARELCAATGERRRLFPVLWGLWTYYLVSAQLQQSRELAEEMIAAAAASSDNVIAVEARHALGTSLAYLGQIARGRSLLEEAVALYHPAQHSAYASLYLLDPSVTCWGQTARFGVLLGYPDQAIRRAREAVGIAESLRHPQSLAYAYLFLAYTHTLREEPEATRDLAELAITLAQEQGLTQIAEWGKILRGWAFAKQGMFEDGVRDMQTSLAAQRAIHAEIDRPMCLGLLARCLLAAERLDDAFDTVVSAIARVDSTNEHWYAAELHRIYADLLARRGDPDGAQRELGVAAVIAGQQSTRLLELRIAVTAARLFRSPPSLEKLRGVYAWFTEGFDIPDLIAARTLIADLNGSICA